MSFHLDREERSTRGTGRARYFFGLHPVQSAPQGVPGMGSPACKRCCLHPAHNFDQLNGGNTKKKKKVQRVQLVRQASRKHFTLGSIIIHLKKKKKHISCEVVKDSAGSKYLQAVSYGQYVVLLRPGKTLAPPQVEQWSRQLSVVLLWRGLPPPLSFFVFCFLA